MASIIKEVQTWAQWPSHRTISKVYGVHSGTIDGPSPGGYRYSANVWRVLSETLEQKWMQKLLNSLQIRHRDSGVGFKDLPIGILQWRVSCNQATCQPMPMIYKQRGYGTLNESAIH